MKITCPLCGERDLREFTIRGAASAPRPASDAWDDSWHDYLHLRDNPAGQSQEFWHHDSGCRAWLKVIRDTRTHEIYQTALVHSQSAPPKDAEGANAGADAGGANAGVDAGGEVGEKPDKKPIAAKGHGHAVNHKDTGHAD